MLNLARKRAAVEGLTNVRFEQADAQIYPFDAGAFDVAISRTGAMFFSDAVMAFQNIGRALRPGGRLALLVWQPLVVNEWIREIVLALSGGRQMSAPPPDAPGPFSLADPDRARSILSQAHFIEIDIAGIHAPFYWGPDAVAARDMVVGLAGWMMQGLDESGRAHALEALRASIAAHVTDDGVQYDSAAWIITAVAAGSGLAPVG
jgi:SAM-dependent methyltransferase